MAAKVIETKEHAKVLVISKGAPELMPFGDKIYKTEFKGSEGGNTATYHTFSSNVAEAIVVGEVIDCDYEVTESADGQFINRKIKQVYQDGQGVVGSGSGGGQKGGRSYGKTPEDSADIARAVALKAAVDMAGHVEIGTVDVVKLAESYLPFLTGVFGYRPQPRKGFLGHYRACQGIRRWGCRCHPRRFRRFWGCAAS